MGNEQLSGISCAAQAAEWKRKRKNTVPKEKYTLTTIYKFFNESIYQRTLGYSQTIIFSAADVNVLIRTCFSENSFGRPLKLNLCIYPHKINCNHFTALFSSKQTNISCGYGINLDQSSYPSRSQTNTSGVKKRLLLYSRRWIFPKMVKQNNFYCTRISWACFYDEGI